jgi:hypothetical protein
MFSRLYSYFSSKTSGLNTEAVVEKFSSSDKPADENVIHLKKFNLDSIQSGTNCIIYGRKRAGKSVLIKDLLRKTAKESTNTIIFNQSESTYPEYQSCGTVYENVSPLMEIVDKQKCSSQTLRVVIENMDDEIRKNKDVRDVILNTRHLKTEFYLSLHYPSLPPVIRNNADYFFIFRDDDNDTLLRKLYENCGNKIPRFAMFKHIIEEMDDYQCLVIANTSTTPDWKDSIFFYKAEF